MQPESVCLPPAPPAANVAVGSGWAIAVRRVFSFPVMLALGLAVVACLTVSTRFNDPDMWWHLKLGQVMWNTGAIPVVDTFSTRMWPPTWVI